MQQEMEMKWTQFILQKMFVKNMTNFFLKQRQTYKL
jgi:hypothetical protein